MSTTPLHDFSWVRMIAAVENVRERATRASAALRSQQISHLVVDGHAVASWVARVDAEAVRNTKDVDLLVRRVDFDRVVATLGSVGFIHRSVNGIDLFLDGPDGSPRSGIHVVFAGEKVLPSHALPTPDVTDCESGPDFPVPTLEALVRMKLTSFRLKDQVHLLDMLSVGLIDATWRDRLPTPLVARLEQILDSPDRDT